MKVARHLLSLIGISWTAKLAVPEATARQTDELRKEFLVQKAKADKGDAVAQKELAQIYYAGRGVETDYAEALKWYRKAAEQGDAVAQSNLGYMYRNCMGVEKDYAEAVKWYRKAAERGFAAAQYNLGLMYRNGEGVEKNYAEAVKWYRKAAEQGDATAQRNLGLMYRDGKGVEMDYREAFAWWNVAAETSPIAAEWCDLIERMMSPQEVGDAQKRTLELKALIETKAQSVRNCNSRK